MIPKIIHYCWFGGNPLPPLGEKCLESWKKHCPDYTILRWDESNFDLSACPVYVQQAYEAKKWAFVTDYVRLKVVYDQGGIYLDTDVELKKSLDDLLEHQAYFGFENQKFVNTGLGFGARQGADILAELMADYRDISFRREDGSLDLMPCPERNTTVFLRHGLRPDGSRQLLPGGILVLPVEYLCPFSDHSGRMTITDNTVSVHWYGSSWIDGDVSAREKMRAAVRRKDSLIALAQWPNRMAMKLLGKERYQALKEKIKGK